MPNRICQCGRDVEHISDSPGRPRKYCMTCSPRRREISDQPVTLFCAVCGSYFDSRCKTVKYCSKKCSNRSRYLPGGSYNKNPIKCASCGCDTPRFSKSVEGRRRCVNCRNESKARTAANRPQSLTWSCLNCGKTKTRPPTKGQVPKYCGKQCEQLAAFHRRRARLADAFVEDVNRLEVFMADGWRCHLCGKLTDKTKPYPHPKSPTIDHVIPINRGGLHERSNCRTACARCNSAKQDRGGGEQFAFAF